MEQKKEFYIGWQEQAPEAYAQKIKKFIWLIAIVVPLVAMSLVLTQRGFADSSFEFGTLTTLEGILVKQPVPMLKIKEGDDIKNVLLVGFGKFGAEADITAFEEKQKESLENKHVKLTGTLIYHDGKTLLELTEGDAAFGGLSETELQYTNQKTMLGDVTLRGEIYDPKCAFGVMKPGYGKPHRSCAVRCISGGIPPVLKIENKQGEKNYCILMGTNGEKVNDDVLDYVADQVQICGRLELQDDWLVLYTDPKADILRLQPHFIEGELPMCTDP